MSNYSFVDQHPLRAALIGNRLQRLVDQISTQGDELLSAAGLDFRAAACSTVLLLHESTGLTTADIGRRLQQPHQLVAQRVNALIDNGLVERVADRKDARRKILMLTPAGIAQALSLKRVLEDSAAALARLQTQIGVDIYAFAEQIQAALDQQSLMQRIEQATNGVTS